MFYRVLSLVVLFFFFASTAQAGMSSASYQINWDSLNIGGNEAATSSSYTLHDTIGELGAGSSTSSSYTMNAGYRMGEGTERLSLSIATQSSTSTPASTYTQINAIGNTVTVATPGAFSIGDTIAIIENQGFSQLVTVGKIQTIASNMVTLDRMVGDQASMQSPPPGSANYVYKLNGTSLPFGRLSTTTETTLVMGTWVRSTAPRGYTVYLEGAGALQDVDAHVIPAVTDGAVTLGSEEYGASVTGDYAVGAGDQGVTTTPRLIASSSVRSGASGDRTAVSLKIGITNATMAGSYTQTIYYTLVPRY